MNLMKQLGEILTKDHSESHYMRFATSWTWTNFLHQTKKEPVGILFYFTLYSWIIWADLTVLDVQSWFFLPYSSSPWEEHGIPLLLVDTQWW